MRKGPYRAKRDYKKGLSRLPKIPDRRDVRADRRLLKAYSFIGTIRRSRDHERRMTELEAKIAESEARIAAMRSSIIPKPTPIIYTYHGMRVH